MSGDAMSDLAIEKKNIIIDTQDTEMGIKAAQKTGEQIFATQVAAKEGLQEESKFITGQAPKNQKSLPERTPRSKAVQRVQESVFVRKEGAEDLAGDFSKREGTRYHLDEDQLKQLAKDLLEGRIANMDEQTILTHIRTMLTVGGVKPDMAQIDKTLDFLVEVQEKRIKTIEDVRQGSEPELTGEFDAMLEKATLLRDRLLAVKITHSQGKEEAITFGHQVIDLADRLVVQQKGKTHLPETLARMREMIHNPQDLITKMNYYRSHGFQYREIKEEIDTMLDFLGNEFKTHDIEPAKLNALIQEVKRSQAILQIYRHFKNRMDLMERLCAKEGLEIPPNITFEQLATLFMSIIDQRYPSTDHVHKLVRGLISSTLKVRDLAVRMEIMILSQERDAVKEVSPTYVFRSLQHRDEVHAIFLQALEELEDELEDLETQEEPQDQAQGM